MEAHRDGKLARILLMKHRELVRVDLVTTILDELPDVHAEAYATINPVRTLFQAKEAGERTHR